MPLEVELGRVTGALPILERLEGDRALRPHWAVNASESEPIGRVMLRDLKSECSGPAADATRLLHSRADANRTFSLDCGVEQLVLPLGTMIALNGAGVNGPSRSGAYVVAPLVPGSR